VNTFEAAVAAKDFDAAAILIGESIGLIDEVRPAADIVADMASHAERIFNHANDFVKGR
jgi:nitronate monooxygenase